MEFRNFDAGLLVALDALLSEKSVTRAGERLHLSQPATSSILARLRECFGNDLLVLTGRRMVLTPLAESLVQPVRDCLLQIQRTVTSKTEFNPATSIRKFCLAVSEYTTAVLLSQALQDIAIMAPGITFELVRLDVTNEQKLEKGEIDFLIRPTAHALAMHPEGAALRGYSHVCSVEQKLSCRKHNLPEEVLQYGPCRCSFRVLRDIGGLVCKALWGIIESRGGYAGFRDCMPVSRGNK